MTFVKKDHSTQKKDDVNLDRFRSKKKRRWWLAGFISVVLLVGIWYALTIFVAVERATTPNIGGSSSALAQNENNVPINILLIGVGGQSHPGGTLADSIMVASIDKKQKTVSLLSIPRDLYVTIPGGGKEKINAAHSFGESNNQGKGGGPAVLKEVVSTTLGIPIHYFVRIDFEGFKKIIDSLGGVTVNVKTAINDPLYPDAQMKGYDPFSITAGPHTLDGKTALKYARSRETTSDFDRARRQQEVIMAIKDQVLSAKVLANPKKTTDIITILGQHILTDFSAGEIDQLITLARDLGNPKINSKVLDNGPDGLLMSSRSSAGASILVPKAGASDFSELQRFARAYIAAPSIKAENPSVELQNAGASKSTMADLKQELEWAGFSVTQTESTASPALKSVFYDNDNKAKPISGDYLEKQYDIQLGANPNTSFTTTYTFVIGPDFAQAQKAKNKTVSIEKATSPTDEATPTLTNYSSSASPSLTVQ